MKIISNAYRRYKCSRCGTSIKKGARAYIETIGRMKPTRLHIECAIIWNRTGNIKIHKNILERIQNEQYKSYIS